MNENFVPFELAKKLKEKGFMEKCIAAYDIGDGEFDFNNYVLRVAYQMNIAAKDCLRLFNNTNTGLIDAPTISQVLRWLREEKEIMVFPVYSTNTSKWYCVAINADSLEQYKLSLSDSYEKAALAGIEYVIDNLI